MAVTAILPPGLAASAAAASGDARIPAKQLGQDDFFKILVTQLANQDPMSPMKDAEFIGQMAQFTSLEQTKLIQSDISQMRSQQQVLQAMGYVGHEALINSSSLGPLTGTITGFDLQDGTPKVLIGANKFDLSEIAAIRLPIPTQSNQSQN